jgi:hypothetical protein
MSSGAGGRPGSARSRLRAWRAERRGGQRFPTALAPPAAKNDGVSGPQRFWLHLQAADLVEVGIEGLADVVNVI